MTRPSDVVVIGGGHNGLVTAALLARQGARVTVLERRAVLGGAAVTEEPWGPGYRVSALSYVVSLMPAQLVADLDLRRHGYHVHPQGPYFVPHRDGGALRLPDDPAARHAEVARFSPRDADAFVRWDAWLGGLARVLGPLLDATPPRVGSFAPRDVLDQLRLAWSLRRLGVPGVADATRLFTMSIADLLDEFFESPEVQGVLAVSGVIGTWAGPRSAGTAYVMAHHKLGDLGDGHTGQWGFPAGGMGAVSAAIAGAARAHGAIVRTDAPVARVDVRGGRARAVVLASGEELPADIVVAAVHPRVAFGELVDRAELPDDLVARIDHWRSRSGVVKINLAVDRLPTFRAHPHFDPDVHGGTIVLADSLDDVEGAFQDAVAGRAAAVPFADICIPSVFDRTLAPDGEHIVSMFTQWVPHSWADTPPPASALDAYVERVLARVDDVAPGFTSSIKHRQVIGPHEMQTEYGLVGGNIFHGELSPDQLFHLRPAPGFADTRTPIAGYYYAGSGVHGGGGVTGVPGMHAARAVARDQRRRRGRRP
ncbi:MAG TPA: NAD(P)/FAD-dependent oxidoreductase [Acidimicrobiia bacterium]|nr:NAD(P)/FAD-dependent oxidoreductase [Acidimicrobiia bacterium]